MYVTTSSKFICQQAEKTFGIWLIYIFIEKLKGNPWKNILLSQFQQKSSLEVCSCNFLLGQQNFGGGSLGWFNMSPQATISNWKAHHSSRNRKFCIGNNLKLIKFRKIEYRFSKAQIDCLECPISNTQLLFSWDLCQITIDCSTKNKLFPLTFFLSRNNLHVKDVCF